MDDIKPATEDQRAYIELDCPWFDPEWLRDHPDFPLAASLVAELDPTRTEEEQP